MPRLFRVAGPAPTSTRRFVLPAHERSTAPAPLPADKPVKAREWGAGAGRETYKRPVQARQVQAVQTGSRGLLTVKAPVGARKGRRTLDFVAADETQMQAFMGTIQLRINRDSVDLGRLENGLLSLARIHRRTPMEGVRTAEGGG